jgi:hypothetical protein
MLWNTHIVADINCCHGVAPNQLALARSDGNIARNFLQFTHQAAEITDPYDAPVPSWNRNTKRW